VIVRPPADGPIRVVAGRVVELTPRYAVVASGDTLALLPADLVLRIRLGRLDARVADGVERARIRTVWAAWPDRLAEAVGPPEADRAPRDTVYLAGSAGAATAVLGQLRELETSHLVLRTDTGDLLVARAHARRVGVAAAGGAASGDAVRRRWREIARAEWRVDKPPVVRAVQGLWFIGGAFGLLDVLPTDLAAVVAGYALLLGVTVGAAWAADVLLGRQHRQRLEVAKLRLEIIAAYDAVRRDAAPGAARAGAARSPDDPLWPFTAGLAPSPGPGTSSATGARGAADGGASPGWSVPRIGGEPAALLGLGASLGRLFRARDTLAVETEAWRARWTERGLATPPPGPGPANVHWRMGVRRWVGTLVRAALLAFVLLEIGLLTYIVKLSSTLPTPFADRAHLPVVAVAFIAGFAWFAASLGLELLARDRGYRFAQSAARTGVGAP
jgi:hypothetical protein